jgi:hypothetical protein
MEDRLSIEVDGESIDLDFKPLMAEDVLLLAGLPSTGIVIRTDGGRAVQFAPVQGMSFKQGDEPAFRTFRDSNLHHLRVNTFAWQWGAPAIAEIDVRHIARVGDETNLYIDGDAAPIRRGSMIDLMGDWPPRISFREVAPEAYRVPVIVNGRTITLDRPDVTFEDLVGLAFPGTDLAPAGMRSLSVTYRRGPPDRPEGSLVSREAIRAQRGEVFNVTATDKA